MSAEVRSKRHNRTHLRFGRIEVTTPYIEITHRLDELLTMLDADTRLVDTDGHEIALGEDVAEAFQAAIAEMRVRGTDELTTQEAARLIGISRPTLIRLLDTGAVAFRRTNGTHGHRRISRRDALTYLRADLQRRRQALDELAADAEAFGFFES